MSDDDALQHTYGSLDLEVYPRPASSGRSPGDAALPSLTTDGRRPLSGDRLLPLAGRPEPPTFGRFWGDGPAPTVPFLLNPHRRQGTPSGEGSSPRRVSVSPAMDRCGSPGGGDGREPREPPDHAVCRLRGLLAALLHLTAVVPELADSKPRRALLDAITGDVLLFPCVTPQGVVTDQATVVEWGALAKEGLRRAGGDALEAEAQRAARAQHAQRTSLSPHLTGTRRSLAASPVSRAVSPGRRPRTPLEGSVSAHHRLDGAGDGEHGEAASRAARFWFKGPMAALEKGPLDDVSAADRRAVVEALRTDFGALCTAAAPRLMDQVRDWVVGLVRRPMVRYLLRQDLMWTVAGTVFEVLVAKAHGEDNPTDEAVEASLPPAVLPGDAAGKRRPAPRRKSEVTSALLALSARPRRLSRTSISSRRDSVASASSTSPLRLSPRPDSAGAGVDDTPSARSLDSTMRDGNSSSGQDTPRAWRRASVLSVGSSASQRGSTAGSEKAAGARRDSRAAPVTAFTWRRGALPEGVRGSQHGMLEVVDAAIAYGLEPALRWEEARAERWALLKRAALTRRKVAFERATWVRQATPALRHQVDVLVHTELLRRRGLLIACHSAMRTHLANCRPVLGEYAEQLAASRARETKQSVRLLGEEDSQGRFSSDPDDSGPFSFRSSAPTSPRDRDRRRSVSWTVSGSDAAAADNGRVTFGPDVPSVFLQRTTSGDVRPDPSPPALLDAPYGLPLEDFVAVLCGEVVEDVGPARRGSVLSDTSPLARRVSFVGSDSSLATAQPGVRRPTAVFAAGDPRRPSVVSAASFMWAAAMADDPDVAEACRVSASQIGEPLMAESARTLPPQEASRRTSRVVSAHPSVPLPAALEPAAPAQAKAREPRAKVDDPLPRAPDARDPSPPRRLGSRGRLRVGERRPTFSLTTAVPTSGRSRVEGHLRAFLEAEEARREQLPPEVVERPEYRKGHAVPPPLTSSQLEARVAGQISPNPSSSSSTNHAPPLDGAEKEAVTSLASLLSPVRHEATHVFTPSPAGIALAVSEGPASSHVVSERLTGSPGRGPVWSAVPARSPTVPEVPEVPAPPLPQAERPLLSPLEASVMGPSAEFSMSEDLGLSIPMAVQRYVSNKKGTMLPEKKMERADKDKKRAKSPAVQSPPRSSPRKDPSPAPKPAPRPVPRQRSPTPRTAASPTPGPPKPDPKGAPKPAESPVKIKREPLTGTVGTCEATPPVGERSAPLPPKPAGKSRDAIREEIRTLIAAGRQHTSASKAGVLATSPAAFTPRAPSPMQSPTHTPRPAPPISQPTKIRPPLYQRPRTPELVKRARTGTPCRPRTVAPVSAIVLDSAQRRPQTTRHIKPPPKTPDTRCPPGRPPFGGHTTKADHLGAASPPASCRPPPAPATARAPAFRSRRPRLDAIATAAAPSPGRFPNVAPAPGATADAATARAVAAAHQADADDTESSDDALSIHSSVELRPRPPAGATAAARGGSSPSGPVIRSHNPAAFLQRIRDRGGAGAAALFPAVPSRVPFGSFAVQKDSNLGDDGPLTLMLPPPTDPPPPRMSLPHADTAPGTAPGTGRASRVLSAAGQGPMATAELRDLFKTPPAPHSMLSTGNFGSVPGTPGLAGRASVVLPRSPLRSANVTPSRPSFAGDASYPGPMGRAGSVVQGRRATSVSPRTVSPHVARRSVAERKRSLRTAQAAQAMAQQVLQQAELARLEIAAAAVGNKFAAVLGIDEGDKALKPPLLADTVKVALLEEESVPAEPAAAAAAVGDTAASKPKFMRRKSRSVFHKRRPPPLPRAHEVAGGLAGSIMRRPEAATELVNDRRPAALPITVTGGIVAAAKPTTGLLEVAAQRRHALEQRREQVARVADGDVRDFEAGDSSSSDDDAPSRRPGHTAVAQLSLFGEGPRAKTETNAQQRRRLRDYLVGKRRRSTKPRTAAHFALGAEGLEASVEGSLLFMSAKQRARMLRRQQMEAWDTGVNAVEAAAHRALRMVGFHSQPQYVAPVKAVELTSGRPMHAAKKTKAGGSRPSLVQPLQRRKSTARPWL